jgi:hypothetical protein
MAETTITPINPSSNTFGDWCQCTNSIVNAIHTYIVTANSSLGVTSGNALVNGHFAANVLYATNGISGGAVGTPAVLPLASNLNFGGQFLLGNTGSSINIGANVWANASHLAAPQINIGTIFSVNSTKIAFNGHVTDNLTPRVSVANNGILIGNAASINFLGTLGVNVSAAVNGANVDVTIAANSGAITVGNSTAGQVMYNQGSIAGGSPALTFDDSSNTLFTHNLVVGSILFEGNTLHKAVSANVQTNTQTIIDFWETAFFRSAEYFITARDTATGAGANAFQSTKLMVLHDGVQPFLMEFATVSSNGDFVNYDVAMNATHLHLLYTANALANSTVHGVGTVIRV